MLLAIDVGNTLIKVALIDEGEIVDIHRCKEETFISKVDEIILNNPNLSEAALCVVGRFSEKLTEFLHNKLKVFTIDDTIKLPFINKYTSKTIGNDRLALVAGTIQQLKNPANTLIIDIGTCITYDFIDHENNYHGGAISPGLRLRYESLHNYTANLPLLSSKEKTRLIGSSTEDSIHSGVINGLRLEIKGFIKSYKKQNKDLNVFITGGDATVLSTRLKNRFFATPFLMLHGIYKLYTYNKNL